MAATLPRADVFSKITDPIEKERILRDLANTKCEIIGKKLDPHSELLVLHAYSYVNFELKCRVVGISQHNIPDRGSLIISYLLGGEKYFQMVDYIKNQQELILIDSHPIYYLQRREDYRIKMTTAYKILLETSSINNIFDKRSIPLQDLSGGGCRIQLDATAPSLRVGMSIVGHLFLPDRDPIAVECIIKYSRFEGNNKSQPIYGLQFQGMSKITKNKIIALVLDLYRQFFTGRS